MSITIENHPGFDKLSQTNANRYLYDEVVPQLEKAKIHLSQYGNHIPTNTLLDNDNYTQLKEKEQLFDIEKIQKAFSIIDQFILTKKRYERSSYGMKHQIEKVLPGDIKYITNGDFIVAMLLKGYKAWFGKNKKSMGVNCQFKANFNKPQEIDNFGPASQPRTSLRYQPY